MKWIINSLSVTQTPEPNTIEMSSFTVSDTQNGISGSVTYSVNMIPVATGAPFTAYSDVTEDQAIEWTKGALGVKRVAAMEQEVQLQIASQTIETPQIAPLPWVEVPVVDPTVTPA